MAVECRTSGDVKGAMSGATASPDTVTGLQRLLGFETTTIPAKSTRPPPGRQTIANTKTAQTKNVKTSAARTKRAQLVEDNAKALSPREKYALATETVNTGLRILTEAAKANQKASGSFKNATPSTPSRGALQPRSNNITPRRPSPEKTRQNGDWALERPSLGGKGPSSHIMATAECTRLAFAYLRSANTEKLGVREMPPLQLETGMLALIGKLIALGLESMAVKELRHVKRRLESSYVAKNAKPAAGLKTKANQPERETLASLLDLNVDFGEDSAARNIAITHSMHTLKVIALNRKTAVIEEAAQYLSIDIPNSPADLLIRVANSGGQSAKAAKQLEALSQTITSLCPSPSTGSDAIAINASKYASPEAVLRLQTIALQIRKHWWDLAGHQADIDRELLEPFLRCAMAFTRRSAATLDADTIYDRLREVYQSLDVTESAASASASLFHNLLSQQAECAGRTNDALKWAHATLDNCNALDDNHARRLSAVVKYASLVLETSASRKGSSGVDEIIKGLESKLSGSAADFDSLLASLHSLASATTASKSSDCAQALFQKALLLAAGFALRYSRSYLGRGTAHVTAIINAAVRCSKSTDDLLSWITPEAAKVFIQANALKQVANVAGRKPLVEAWETSQDALSLSRICRALTLSAVRSPSKGTNTGFVDDEELPAGERGALLELQLQSMIQLSSKTKYHSTMRRLISGLLDSLDNVYARGTHPIRRTRVAITTLRLHETCPELLSADALAKWQRLADVDEKLLGNDIGLIPYLEDLKAALIVSKAFSGGNPTFEQLQPALQSWSGIVRECADAAGLRTRIDDPANLIQQLRMIVSYFSMRGDEQSCLPVLILVDKTERLLAKEDKTYVQASTSTDLAKCYLELGHTDRAGRVLTQADKEPFRDLRAIQNQSANAEHLLAIRKTAECARALEDCRTSRETLTPENVAREDRRLYERLHAEAWFAHSKHGLESGSPHQALIGAKRCVKVLNSMWAGLERASSGSRGDAVDEGKDKEASDASVNSLTKGVSKLQLTPKDESADKHKTSPAKGAAFWPLVPILTKALMHLSDLYAHHGLFSEANYYSERAITIAESVGSSTLLSRIRSHRAQLLTLGGRVEEAELCLTQDEGTKLPEFSLAAVERLRAKSAVDTKEESFEEAIEKLEKARRMIEEMSSGEFIARLERFGDDDELAEKTAALSIADLKPSAAKKPAARAPAKRPTARVKTSQPSTKKTQPSKPAYQPTATSDSVSFFSGMKADIALSTLTLKLRLDRNIDHELSQLTEQSACLPETRRKRVAEHLHHMAEANAALEMDVVMNVLAESTLSLPSFSRPEGKMQKDAISETASSSAAAPEKATARSKKSTAKSKTVAESEVVKKLRAARECLLKGLPGPGSGGTAQTHSQSSMLASASMLLSAVSDQQSGQLVRSLEEGLNLDQPRMKALYYERQAGRADKALSDISEPLSWPMSLSDSATPLTTAADFRESYIDILPEPWTAVSLCLNEDATELYLVRYRRAQDPFILRLPFSRHKPDSIDDEEETFDYAKGKAELREIIELSDYTCHSSRNLEAKGAKTTWWSDREALDRRMHELLINMENIWFGGFRSIFSMENYDDALLAQFRQSFDEVLERYLPSRQATFKGKAKRLRLDDKVLELFIGLGHDQDGIVDLDEPLADLLYFVVDLLQFSGERNAYDEVDFDSMAVDVLDALRTYHEGVESRPHGNHEHLILVLDRRLQAFPWENMPCLQDQSVSRVGSMQSLRECIVAMRSAYGSSKAKLPNTGDGCHVVERTTGSYILNPSSDLKATQTMLSPVLTKLSTSTGQPWNSIVNEAPDEQRFSTALQDSTMLLYFGHGAGSQYIRPRAIKRLDKCSEVVWLMGCSSGAVTENGDLEPSAVPHAYLLSGTQNTSQDQREEGGKCLSVLATLWDVTDKDIDRFSLSVGEEWGLWPPPSQPSNASTDLPAKTLKKRIQRQLLPTPSTPQQVPKTPKTPKVLKTPAAAKTPARGKTRRQEGRVKSSLAQAVARSREVCYLRYLNGAAPVVYGVPVYLGD